MCSLHLHFPIGLAFLLMAQCRVVEIRGNPDLNIFAPSQSDQLGPQFMQVAQKIAEENVRKNVVDSTLQKLLSQVVSDYRNPDHPQTTDIATVHHSLAGSPAIPSVKPSIGTVLLTVKQTAPLNYSTSAVSADLVSLIDASTTEVETPSESIHHEDTKVVTDQVPTSRTDKSTVSPTVHSTVPMMTTETRSSGPVNHKSLEVVTTDTLHTIQMSKDTVASTVQTTVPTEPVEDEPSPLGTLVNILAGKLSQLLKKHTSKDDVEPQEDVENSEEPKESEEDTEALKTVDEHNNYLQRRKGPSSVFANGKFMITDNEKREERSLVENWKEEHNDEVEPLKESKEDLALWYKLIQASRPRPHSYYLPKVEINLAQHQN